MGIVIINKKRQTLFLMSIILLLSGCRQNLDKVEEFGLTSSVIRDSSSTIISDIYNSCIRKEKHEISIDKLRQENFSTTIFSEEKNFEPVRLNENCKDARKQSEIFDRLNTVLIDYVAVLGRLASRNTVSFNQNLALIETSINANFATSLTGADQDAFQVNVASVLGATNSILNLVADQQRQNSLKPIIVCTNDDFKDYISNFNNLISDYYISGLLEDEEDALGREYEMLFNRQRLPEESLRENFATNMSIIDDHKKSAKTHQKILKRTAIAHDSLANIFSNDVNEKNELCENYKNNISLNNNNNNNNIGNNSNSQINSKQMKEAKKVLDDYLTDIKVLKERIDK